MSIYYKVNKIISDFKKNLLVMKYLFTKMDSYFNCMFMNKKNFLIKIILIFGLGSIFAQENLDIKIKKYPESVNDFLKFRSELANTPEGGAFLTILALDAYAKGKPDAIKFLTLMLTQNNLQKSSSPNSYNGYEPSKSYFNFHLQRMENKPYFMECYIKDNTISFNRNQYSKIKEDQIKVFVVTHLPDIKPRPITMERNDKGIWKAKELSSLFLGCPSNSKPVDDL
jgi:hypothetical protein